MPISRAYRKRTIEYFIPLTYAAPRHGLIDCTICPPNPAGAPSLVFSGVSNSSPIPVPVGPCNDPQCLFLVANACPNWQLERRCPTSLAGGCAQIACHCLRCRTSTRTYVGMYFHQSECLHFSDYNAHKNECARQDFVNC